MNGSPQSADVVMLGTFSAWNLGTLQARALPMALALKNRSVNVAIVTTPWDAPGEAGVIDSIDGVHLINTLASSAVMPLPAVREQLSWVQRLRPSVVHVMKPRGFGGLAGLRLHGNVPLVVDSDDWEGDGGWNDSGKYSWPQQRIFHAQEHDLLIRADVVTAASTLLAQRARALRGDQADVHLVVNGITEQRRADLNAARIQSPSEIDPPVVVLYSRFEEFEDDWLARFVLELASRTALRVKIRVIGRERTLADPPVRVGTVLIELMGYVASQAVPQLLGSSTLAVYPYQDSLITRSKQSVKLLELMAAGCPVIASDVGDVSRTLGPAGIVIAGADPAAFAETTAHVLQKRNDLNTLSEIVQARVRDRFGFDTISQTLMTAYQAAGLR